MKIVIERDVPVAMRDGIHLMADVYRPDGPVPVPVLVHRLPYGKSQLHEVFGVTLSPLTAVERGYGVVVQDTRGTGLSEGTYRPIFQEREDGHDTIDWAAAQPWSTGDVGIYGASYMGVTTLQATVDAPHALKASLACLTSANYHETWCYAGGAYELGFQLRWALALAVSRLGRLGPRDSELRQRVEDAWALYQADPIGFYSRSGDAQDLLADCLPLTESYARHLDHPDYDDYWKEIDVLLQAEHIRVPVLNIAGWHDGFLKSGIDLHQALVRSSAEEMRSHHVLKIGPWDHGSFGGGVLARSSAGSRDFGPAATGGQPGIESLALAWFDRWLKGSDQPQSSSVTYFLMGPNVWRESEAWPPPAIVSTAWFLHSVGNAADRNGGWLSMDRPADEPADSYIHDPVDPCPSHGGRHLVYALPSGVQDQSAVQARADVAVYTSAILSQPLTVLGPLKLDLWVRASASPADYVAMLCDVTPTGEAFNVADGVIRVQSTDTDDGSPIRVTVGLWDTAYTFPAGSQLRLQITSSSFARYDKPRGTDGSPVVNHLYHDRLHPSSISLPVAQELSPNS